MILYVIFMNFFCSGVKVNDPTHPDYVPSLFPKDENAVAESRAQAKIGRFERLSNRRQNVPGEAVFFPLYRGCTVGMAKSENIESFPTHKYPANFNLSVEYYFKEYSAN